MRTTRGRVMSQPLPDYANYGRFILLDLNKRGQFVYAETGQPVAKNGVVLFLQNHLRVPSDVTDIFVWVHGWQNSKERALRSSRRLFGAIDATYNSQPEMYPRLAGFRPMNITIRWPSESSLSPWGYRKVRNRAHEMTTQGFAEFSLSHLLGYLDSQRGVPGGRDMLRTTGGQYLHCVGHSFGGRFLAEAIAASPMPNSSRLPLLPPNKRFRYTVDSFVVYQMAARSAAFSDKFQGLVEKGPLQGPTCLTFSPNDRACKSWHRFAERGHRAIGAHGATEPRGVIKNTRLLPVDQQYDPKELTSPLVNIDAGWLYRRGKFMRPEGAHSDIWYPESIHLLLTLANYAR